MCNIFIFAPVIFCDLKKFLIKNYTGYNICVYSIICDVLVIVKKAKIRSSQKTPDEWYTGNLSIHDRTMLNNETLIEVYLESILVHHCINQDQLDEMQ